ncbi:MAG: hypothetical protein IJ561_05035 [Ruminococcus sp.]|nr:hypothetical protein [Ruminococcus sp.]
MKIISTHKRTHPTSVLYILSFTEEEIETQPLLKLFEESNNTFRDHYDPENMEFYAVEVQSRDGLHNNRRVKGVLIKSMDKIIGVSFENRTYDLNEFLKEGHRDIGLTPEEIEKYKNGYYRDLDPQVKDN